MKLVPSLPELVRQLAFVMTAPTLDTFLTIMNGWVVAPRHTVTGAIPTADAVRAQASHGLNGKESASRSRNGCRISCARRPRKTFRRIP